jgi:FMN-dependent NADH-azoreductase
MPYLLHIAVSPQGENSRSRALANEFIEAYKTAHPDHDVFNRDIDKEPVPHLDGEALIAGYLPEESRSEGMKSKHQLRLDLVKEITEADAIVVSTPMWNWSVPSVLKAYIDQIIVIGALDPYSNRKLEGKSLLLLSPFPSN